MQETGEYFPPLQSHGKIVGGDVAIYRPFGEFHRANSYCNLDVLRHGRTKPRSRGLDFRVLKVYGGRGLYLDNGHHKLPDDIPTEIPSFSENTTGKTVEIVQIDILLRLNREQDEAPIVAESLGPGPVGPCLKTTLAITRTHN
ncbi:hypothetical protein TNCV_4146321 [Trichonephila clavipes]|nr:hypothetical protein TNCV_4146321 [Trichonephila clavipes]